MKIWLDDLRPSPDSDWVICHSVNEAIKVLQENEIEEISLDHDLGDYAHDGGDGTHLVDWMAEYNVWPTVRIAIHSANPVGREQMRATVNRYAPYDAVMSPVPRTV
jgi:hypothetical protein